MLISASPTYNDSVTDVKRYFPDGLCCANTLDMQAEGVINHNYFFFIIINQCLKEDTI